MRTAHSTMRRRIIAALISAIASAIAAGCTAGQPDRAPGPTPRPPGGTTQTAPVNAFPPLADRKATGARVVVNDVAAAGNRVVSVGQYADGQGTVTFGYSLDGGQTWRPGMSPAPEQALTETAFDVAVRATPQGMTWVATGVVETHVATWTSRDGISWERHILDPGIADPKQDGVTELVAAGEGFYAGGRSYDASADVTHPRAWTSVDGVTWTRHKLPGRGEVSALTVRGDTVVAVGGTDDDVRVWKSTDQGRAWTTVSKIPRASIDEHFNRHLDGVVVDGKDFVAIGSYYGADDYHPMLLRSKDGSRWRVDERDIALDLDGGSFGRRLVSHNGELVAVTETNQTLAQAKLYRWNREEWRPMTDSRPKGDKAVWSVNGVARSSEGWVAAAARDLDNSEEAQLWLTREPWNFVRRGLPAAPRTTPVLSPVGLVPWHGATRVIGEAQDSRAMWTQTDDGVFGTPQQLNLGADANIEGLAADGAVLLAYGSTTGGNTNHATTWRSADGKTFTASGRDTFEKVAPYSSSTITRVHKLGNVWFAVGERTSNADLNASALIFTSVDGAHWTPGKAARLMKKARGKIWYDVTDLAGDHDRRRSMTDITRTSHDLLAVGDTEENGPKRATVWHSVNGSVWQSKVIGAAGFDRSGIGFAASIGTRTVLYGWAGLKGHNDTTPYVWSSDDGGQSWRGRSVGTEGDDADYLVATDTAFVVTGSGDAEVSHPWLMQSGDAETWQPLTLSGVQAAADEQVWLSDAAAQGHELICLVRVVNRAGAGTTLVRQAVG